MLKDLEPVFASIVKANQSDAKLLADSYARFSIVEALFTEGQPAVDSKEQVADVSRELHGTCRKQQTTILPSITESERLVNETKSRMADTLAAVEGAGRSVSLWFQAADPGSATLSAFVQHEHLVEQYHAELQAHIEVWKTHNDNVQKLENATKVYAEKEKACGEKQVEFERAICTLGDSMQSLCSSHVSEYNIHLQDYEALSSAIAEKVYDRKVEWAHLKKIACILDKFAAVRANTSLSTNSSVGQKIQGCYEADFANEDLAIPVVVAPPPQACPTLPTLPCTVAFHAEEYADLPAELAVACKSDCAMAMPTNAPAATTQAPTPAPMPEWVQCARIKNFRGPQVDTESGVDGNTYLSSSWGESDFADRAAFGNHCPDIAHPSAVEFKVLDGSFNLNFETGAFALQENVFVTKSGLYSETSETGAVFKVEQVDGQQGRLIYGSRCASVHSNGYRQRTTFCVAKGGQYQSILGGINGDNYGNGRGPCMCNPNSMCGHCGSSSIVEIYMKTVAGNA